MFARGKFVFRPAWGFYIAPAWAVAAGLVFLTAKATQMGLLLREFAAFPYLVPLAFLAVAYIRWLSKGHIAIQADRVIFQGWVTKTEDGVARQVYTRRIVPRTDWGAITVEGLLLPRVTWSNFGERIVFERVGHPRQLCKLLKTPAKEFGQDLSPSASDLSVLALIGLGKGLAELAKLMVAGVGWLALRSWPYLKQAGHWMFKQARQAFATLKTQPATPARSLPTPRPEYARFLAFCRNRVLGTGLVEPEDVQASLYVSVLEQAHILYRHVNGRTEWRLYPRIKNIRDIVRRISPETFEQAFFKALLANVELEGVPEEERSPALAAVN